MQPKEAHYQSDDRRSTADRNDLPRQPNCAEASDSSFNSKRSIGNDGPSNPRASSGTSRIHHLHPIEKRTPHHQIHRTKKDNRVPTIDHPFNIQTDRHFGSSVGYPPLWSPIQIREPIDTRIFASQSELHASVNYPATYPGSNKSAN